MENKKHMGFRLPHESIQEEHEEIVALLGERTVDWTALEKLFMDKAVSSLKEAGEQLDSRKGLKDVHQYAYGTNVAMAHFFRSEHNLTRVMLCRIGLELTEANLRIAGCEKEIKSLKRSRGVSND